MQVLFSGQVPKDHAFPDSIEDAFELAPGRIAVSDGASESFDSKTWANLLTARFVEQPGLGASWLATVIEGYAGHYDVPNLSWSKEAAYERGSFATLLGIEERLEHRSIDVLGIGDSLAVLLDGGVFVASFPYVHSQEFQQRPELLSTKPTQNEFVTAPDFFLKHHRTWSIEGIRAPLVLCMTDALAEWALRNTEEGRPVWELLADIEKLPDFDELVLRERQAKTMRIDDATLVRVSFAKLRSDELPEP